MSFSYSQGLGIRIEITDNSVEVLEALQNAIYRGLEAIGASAEEHAIQNVTEVVYSTPERGYVRTGNLRNRITHEVLSSEKAVMIGEQLEYAPYVELGTSKMKPRPFLKPAVADNKDEYRNLIKDSLENA